MRDSFDKAFALTIGLEGKPSDDPRDPGGFTIWGLAKKYHHWISMKTTKGQAKETYFTDYWLPAGCDAAPYPMDICLFDSQVNPQNDPKWPGGGNQEIMNMKPENWQDYQLLRMIRYMRNSKACFVDGHIMRVVKLSQEIKGL